MSDPMIQAWIQYTHLDKLYGHLPGMTRAPPGDSVTDDLQSWAEILRHLLDLRRPGDGVRVVNGGPSAHTTAMVLRRIAAAHTSAWWVWITPAPVHEERIASFPPFLQGESTWRNADVLALAEAIELTAFACDQRTPVRCWRRDRGCLMSFARIAVDSSTRDWSASPIVNGWTSRHGDHRRISRRRVRRAPTSLASARSSPRSRRSSAPRRVPSPMDRRRESCT